MGVSGRVRGAAGPLEAVWARDEGVEGRRGSYLQLIHIGQAADHVLNVDARQHVPVQPTGPLTKRKARHVPVQGAVESVLCKSCLIC